MSYLNRLNNPVARAAEKVAQERKERESIRSLRPDHDLTWERLESTEDDFAREIDYDRDYY